MKTLFAFTLVSLFVGSFADRYCYNKVVQDCASGIQHVSCNANYGNFPCVEPLFNDLFKNYLMRSNEYLLIKTNFDNYEYARPGFAQLFGQLSDRKWETAIRIIKFITNRNGEVEFGPGNAYTAGAYDIHELPAMAMATDIEKQFAIDTNEIHEIVTGPPNKHDMDVAWYIQNKFAFQQSKLLRQLVGYVSVLTKMSDSINYAVGLTTFDDYLYDEDV
ncbi:ferritin light chain-like [Atheta coriaria]|uniref:ferritin light chain-like n=1 Tax=Dalotia coriaria TaxID=877792 RepID=UPI0031F37A8A